VKCERKLIAEKKGYNFSGYAGTVKRAVKRFACAEPLLTKNFKQSCALNWYQALGREANFFRFCRDFFRSLAPPLGRAILALAVPL
jgi:hypothetical protein